MPSAVYQLGANDIYPVESDSPLVIRSYPKGLVEFQEMKPGVYFWKAEGKWQQKEFKGPHLYFGTATGEGRTEVEFFWAEDGAVKSKTALIDCLVGPQPPPPDPPGPKPPDPKPPEPVTSFRVIFVYETADLLTPLMQRVMFGEKVRTYLDAATTSHPVGGKGWRRFDKDVNTVNERDPDIKALWNDARPKVTTVPCVIVAVNRKAVILPFPASEEEALKIFQKYAEGK